jgi:hypothetical protein
VGIAGRASPREGIAAGQVLWDGGSPEWSVIDEGAETAAGNDVLPGDDILFISVRI